MFYVITSACIDVKDATCQTVCPVDCIYVGGRMLYIQPDECINCALCVPACPVSAIYKADEVADPEKPFIAANAQFFGPEVTGWGEPGGASEAYVSELDAPLVRDWPKKA